MRQVNKQILSGANTVTVVGSQIDSNQLVNISFHLVVGDATAAGSLIIDGSNDVAQIGPTPFTVVSWAPISTTTQAAGTQQLIVQLSNVSYRWVRARWVQSTAGTTTVVVNLMAAGV